MEENVIKELKNLEGMVLNWKRSFLGWASPEGDNDYVYQDFSEDIQKLVYPYVRRLYETNHLSASEAEEFMNNCYRQVEDLRDQLKDVETKQSKKEV
jgi:hypothetical protein